MSEESELEKTEPASQKRLEKAREEGDVPRSRELSTVTMLLASGGCLWIMGEFLFASLTKVLKDGLTFNKSQATDITELFRGASSSVVDVLIAFAPFGALLLFVAIGSPLIIGGWNFSSKAFIPKFGKLNPIKGVANLVSKNSAMELLKAVIKTAFVGIVAWIVIGSKMGEFTRLSDMAVKDGVLKLGSLMWVTYISIVGSLVLIAVLDVAYQLWHYNDKLMMTKQELKEEAKESDGNPEIKAKIRQQQREMSRRRMMADVPTADVVVTNPTHYSVALSYKDGSNGAPRVVAKGKDEVAAKIREVAKENGVPLLEAPPLARALHEHAEIGDEIPEALYSAVAEVLAYVFQLKSFNQSGGSRPSEPSSIVVPPDLDPLNKVLISQEQVE